MLTILTVRHTHTHTHRDKQTHRNGQAHGDRRNLADLPRKIQDQHVVAAAAMWRPAADNNSWPIFTQFLRRRNGVCRQVVWWLIRTICSSRNLRHAIRPN